MITTQIVLHIRDLDLQDEWLNERAYCKDDCEVIVDGGPSNRILADQEPSMNHTLMIPLEMLLLLCIGVHARGSWRHGPPGSFG